MKQKRMNRIVIITLYSVFQLFGFGSIMLADTAASCCKTNCYTSHNTYLLRAFISYSLHEILNNELLFFLENTDHKAYLSVASEYMQNFGTKGISSFGALPFWSGTNSMTVGNNNGLADLDAYQFGLGNVITGKDGIAGTIQLCPKVQHVGADFMLYYSHFQKEPSFYFKLHAPIVAMMVSPNFTEPVITKPDEISAFTQTTSAPNSTNIVYRNAFYPTVERRYLSMSHAFFGGVCAPDTMKGSVDKPIQLNHGLIATGRYTQIRMADLAMTLGYNFIANGQNMFAVGFKATCPTGNVPQANAMLEPIVGRAGAWAVGGECTGHYTCWQHETYDRALYLDIQGEVLHLMPGRVPNYRSFDLKQNGPGSKYLLLQHYPDLIQSTTGNNYVDLRVPRSLKTAINMTTLPVISKISVEGSIATQLKYLHDHWTISIGGEFWGRSQEHLAMDITSIVRLRLETLNNYAVVGRQIGTYDINGQVPFNANLCEPLARINTSKDPIQLIGNPAIAPGVTVPTTLPDGIKDATMRHNRIPEKLSDALDICGAQAPSVMSGKVFASTGYIWKEHAYIPSLVFFGGAEFTNNNSLPRLWSVGLSGNIQF